MSQVRCKVCKKPSMINKSRPASEVKYRCPHCENRLFKWKEKSDVIIYKCPNFKCRLYLQNKSNLNEKEKNVYDKGKTSHFSLHYIYREYHFKPAELVPSRPHNTGVDLHKAHHTDHTIGLVLTYSISYGLSARMTADLMQNVHSISMSHQTVINYMTSAASYVSRFMEQHKLELTSDSCSADETYLKVKGKNRYTWFVIDTISRAIVGFHLSDERDTKNALIAIIDAFGESPDPLKEGQKPVNFVADGNPSYDAAILEYQRHIEDTSLRPILRRKVIGLENKDDESTEYRQLKQLVERLNRTYKFHTRPRAGFKNMQGAIVLTTLFVVFYNYMRPKTRRTESPPINHNLFKGLGTYQEKWCKILKLAG